MTNIMTQPPVLHFSFYTRHESDDDDDVLLSAVHEHRQQSPSPQRQSPAVVDRNSPEFNSRACRSVRKAMRTLTSTGNRSCSSKAHHRPSFSLTGLSSDESWLPKRSASPLDATSAKERKTHEFTSSESNSSEGLFPNREHARQDKHASYFVRCVHSEEEDNDDEDDEDDEGSYDHYDNDIDCTKTTYGLITDGTATPRSRNDVSMSHSTPCTPIRTRFTSIDSAFIQAKKPSIIVNGVAEEDEVDDEVDDGNDTSDTAISTAGGQSFTSSLTAASSVKTSHETDDDADDDLDCSMDNVNSPESEHKFPASTSVLKQQMQLMVRHRQRHPDYIYHAPCEHYPSQAQTGYLVNDRCRKYDNLLSVVEFGVRAADCLPVTFKTVADTYLAVRELAAFDRVAGVENVVQLIDTFLDDQSRRVFILPRLRPLNWAEHDLIDLARLLRQMLSALYHVHQRGLVHLDINQRICFKMQLVI
ncbi:hypothetical protein BDF19DRAFT_158075 [Syncephalis fuscata]|nr:hypothetical protein BDF19DRAFT_158075 [Syncephalis fuscata]